MSTMLLIIALVLMVVSAGLCLRQNATVPSQGDAGGRPKNQSLITLLVASGVLVACGGFWADWLLWLGLVMIEIGCIAWCWNPAGDQK